MSSGIYAYWDNVNGYYAYVGKDSYINIKSRHHTHFSPSMYDDQPFNRILQNNPERYEYRVLMEGNYDDKQLNKMEKFLIKHLKTYHYDYPDKSVFNFTKGGDGQTGLIHTEETKKKMSNIHRGRTHSEDHKINQAKSRNKTGYYHVSKKKEPRVKQGYTWEYRYYEDGKYKAIQSVSFEKLEKKVKAKGLPWRVL